jgi:hypothetical protein
MPNPMILEDDHPVFIACETGDLNSAEECFREGVSVHSESEHNSSLIGIAAFHENKKLIDLMLKYGLDINRPYNRFGASVAEFAIHKDSVEWLEYFFLLGVPINALDGTGHSLLELAAGGAN